MSNARPHTILVITDQQRSAASCRYTARPRDIPSHAASEGRGRGFDFRGTAIARVNERPAG